MRYLLDTCLLSETTRPNPEQAVLEWLEAKDNLRFFVSVLTFGEIAKGIAKSEDQVRQKRLTRWLEEVLVPWFGSRVLPVDDQVARTWGVIAATAEQHGRPIPVVDGLIAATASVHRLTVATRNTDHFVETGVEVINPWPGSGRR